MGLVWPRFSLFANSWPGKPGERTKPMVNLAPHEAPVSTDPETRRRTMPGIVTVPHPAPNRQRVNVQVPRHLVESHDWG